MPGGAVAESAAGKSAPAASNSATNGPLAVVSNPPPEVAVSSTFSYQIQLLPENASVKYKVESGRTV